MSCSCVQCRVNGATLGLDRFPASRGAIHDAYRRAALSWHPDRFASNPDRIHEAEERFKQAQVAYRELTEHNPEEEDDPLPESAKQSAASAEPPFSGIHWKPGAPSVLFGHLAGCYVAPDLPSIAEAIVQQHLSMFDYPTAIFDLTLDGSFHRFFLIASHGVIVKDLLGSISLLRYEDVGNIDLLNRERSGKMKLWEIIAERLSGEREQFSLDVYRQDGSHFCSLTGQVNDSAKSAIYHYLTRRKQKFNPS